jgi:hypothetical protein
MPRWMDDPIDAFEEEISRILLGEPPPARKPAAVPTPWDVLRKARHLIEELADLVGEAEGPAVGMEVARARLAGIGKLAARLSELCSSCQLGRESRPAA